MEVDDSSCVIDRRHLEALVLRAREGRSFADLTGYILALHVCQLFHSESIHPSVQVSLVERLLARPSPCTCPIEPSDCPNRSLFMEKVKLVLFMLIFSHPFHSISSHLITSHIQHPTCGGVHDNNERTPSIAPRTDDLKFNAQLACSSRTHGHGVLSE